MTTAPTETPSQAWARRRAHAGEVDFTSMYVAHDAFSRDLGRLLAAAHAGEGLTPAALGTWQLFSEQLHNHHTTEDVALWPRLRAAVEGDAENALLDQMAAEHAELDPCLDRVEAAIADRHAEGLRAGLEQLASGLRAHLRHEEEEALPLVERRLGPAGWAAFGAEVQQRSAGLEAAAAYLPWALDGATDEVRDQVLQLLPPPVRSLYPEWEESYRGAGRLTG